MPDVRETPLLVIGGGPAGYPAALHAADHGLKVTLVDEGTKLGGVCLNRGCIPSKALIYAGTMYDKLARQAEKSGLNEMGISVSGTKLDLNQLMTWKTSVVKKLTGGVAGLLKANGCAFIAGDAKFTGPRGMEVKTAEGTINLSFNQCVIATGSRPSVPPPFRALGDRLVVNDDVFAWDDLPRRVAVFGPGVIGLELGQALARLGVEVRVFGVSGSLGGISDPQVRSTARKIFQREFYLDPDARVLETVRVGDEVEVRYVTLDNTERTAPGFATMSPRARRASRRA